MFTGLEGLLCCFRFPVSKSGSSQSGKVTKKEKRNGATGGIPRNPAGNNTKNAALVYFTNFTCVFAVDSHEPHSKYAWTSSVFLFQFQTRIQGGGGNPVMPPHGDTKYVVLLMFVLEIAIYVVGCKRKLSNFNWKSVVYMNVKP